MPGNKKILNGFTIVELTVALSVSAIVLATGYDLFKALRNVGNNQDQSMAQSQKMVDALERIKEDLLHAVPASHNQKVIFSGSNAVVDSGKFKLLEFYSLCVTGYPNKICGVRQIHKIEYELVREKDSILLYRTAIPVIEKNKLTDEKTRKPILDKVEQIRVSFHDGSKLLPSFSSKQHLPVYVQIELVANGQNWPLSVNLPCGTAQMEQSL